MEANAIPTLVALFWCVVSGSWAAERSDGGGDVATSALAPPAVSGTLGPDPPIEPWIHPAMPARVKTRLEAGFKLAVERIREIEACGALFTRLGANGLDMLRTGLYFPVDSYRREVEVCGRNAAASSRGAENLAYTTVGGAPTWICRHFSRVSDETAAVAVTHEALHHAGLTEESMDRTAMSSVEITEMVKQACGY